MRIAFITFEYPPSIVGGAGTYAHEICSNLGRAGHEVMVFMPRYKGDPALQLTDGVRAHYVRMGRLLPRSVKFWLELPKAIAREGAFDILHMNSFNYLFLTRRRLASCPHLMTVHHLACDAHRAAGWGIADTLRNPGSEDGLLIPLVERACMRSMDAFMAVSEQSRGRAIEEYNLSRERVFLVHNGVATMEWQGHERAAAFRQSMGIPPGPLLLFLGRFEDHRKGVDILLSAMERLGESVKLLIVGKGDQEKFKRSLGEKLRERVFFSGFVSDRDIASSYECADLCVVPSRMEGFSLTAINAMAGGKPVVASDIGALREVVGDDDQLFRMGDSVHLAEKIALLLSDRELASMKGMMNRHRAGLFKPWNEVAAQVEAIYRQLVDGPSNPSHDGSG